MLKSFITNAALVALVAAIAAIVGITVKDTLHHNDCQAAADAMQVIASNVDLFDSVVDMKLAAQPHLKFYTTECMQ